MTTQKAAAAAATLLFDSAEHVSEIARVVTGACHNARAEYVGFSFIFATELQEVDPNALACI